MNRRLLICDLDNTLYDWVGYFAHAFYAMVDEVVSITDCDREQLLDDFQIVHRRHHDSEHPFSLLETDTIEDLFANCSRGQVAKKLDPAFHAFNVSRKKKLKLYPGVRKTLETLLRSNVKIVAHTESKLYGVVDRLTRLELTDYFHRIYCRERSDSEHPDPDAGFRWFERFPLERTVELSRHQTKPNPDVLLEMCSVEGVSPSRTVYVGDSMARDILMAKAAGVFSVWAKYGTFHTEEEYRQLIRISHWTSDDIVREQELKKATVGLEPDFVIERDFGEVIGIFGGEGFLSEKGGSAMDWDKPQATESSRAETHEA